MTLKALQGAVNAVLAFTIGAGLGFCCLEFIGAPLLIAVLWIGRYAAKSFVCRSDVALRRI